MDGVRCMQVSLPLRKGHFLLLLGTVVRRVCRRSRAYGGGVLLKVCTLLLGTLTVI